MELNEHEQAYYERLHQVLPAMMPRVVKIKVFTIPKDVFRSVIACITERENYGEEAKEVTEAQAAEFGISKGTVRPGIFDTGIEHKKLGKVVPLALFHQLKAIGYGVTELFYFNRPLRVGEGEAPRTAPVMVVTLCCDPEEAAYTMKPAEERVLIETLGYSYEFPYIWMNPEQMPPTSRLDTVNLSRWSKPAAGSKRLRIVNGAEPHVYVVTE